jgi:hypothetical protein
MNREQALGNLQALINVAIQKGLFQNSTAVLEMQQSLEIVKEEKQAPQLSVADKKVS